MDTQEVWDVDKELTRDRVRKVVFAEPLGFMVDLSAAELTDMVLCAGALVNSLGTLLPGGFLEEMFND